MSSKSSHRKVAVKKEALHEKAHNLGLSLQNLKPGYRLVWHSWKAKSTPVFPLEGTTTRDKINIFLDGMTWADSHQSYLKSVKQMQRQ